MATSGWKLDDLTIGKGDLAVFLPRDLGRVKDDFENKLGTRLQETVALARLDDDYIEKTAKQGYVLMCRVVDMRLVNPAPGQADGTQLSHDYGAGTWCVVTATTDLVDNGGVLARELSPNLRFEAHREDFVAATSYYDGKSLAQDWDFYGPFLEYLPDDVDVPALYLGAAPKKALTSASHLPPSLLSTSPDPPPPLPLPEFVLGMLVMFSPGELGYGHDTHCSALDAMETYGVELKSGGPSTYYVFIAATTIKLINGGGKKNQPVGIFAPAIYDASTNKHKLEREVVLGRDGVVQKSPPLFVAPLVAFHSTDQYLDGDGAFDVLRMLSTKAGFEYSIGAPAEVPAFLCKGNRVHVSPKWGVDPAAVRRHLNCPRT